MSNNQNTIIDENKAEMAEEGNYHLLDLALDADMYSKESHIKTLIPTRALFTNVKELSYLSEVDSIIEKAIEAAAGGSGLNNEGRIWCS